MQIDLAAFNAVSVDPDRRVASVGGGTRIGAQLVTADSEVLELGPGRNEDLFWAIRGGGGNFGVVTRLDFRPHPVRTFHAATFQFGWTDTAGAMRLYGELVRETPDEVRAVFTVGARDGRGRACAKYDPANLFRSNQNVLPAARS